MFKRSGHHESKKIKGIVQRFLAKCRITDWKILKIKLQACKSPIVASFVKSIDIAIL
jgi:hypothetical protein